MSKDASQLFHIGDILAIINGRFRPMMHRPPMADGTIPPERDDPLDGLGEILRFMTRLSPTDKMENTVYPRAAAECRPLLIEKYGFLQNVQQYDLTAQNYIDIVEKIRPQQMAPITEAVQRLLDSYGNDLPGSSNLYPTPLTASAIAEVAADHIANEWFKKLKHTQPELGLPLQEPNALGSPFERWKAALEADIEQRSDDDPRQAAMRKFRGALADMKHAMHRQSKEVWETENYSRVIQPLEKEYGAYLSVPQLSHFETIDPLDEVRNYNKNIEAFRILDPAPPIPEKFVTIPMFDLSAEESVAIHAEQHADIAQAVYALVKKDILHVLQPEDIVEKGGNIEIRLHTMDYDKAQELHTWLCAHMPKETIQDHITLGMTTQEEDDQYVIQIHANELKAAGLSENFLRKTNIALGIDALQNRREMERSNPQPGSWGTRA